jgi:hypothetical protein
MVLRKGMEERERMLQFRARLRLMRVFSSRGFRSGELRRQKAQERWQL